MNHGGHAAPGERAALAAAWRAAAAHVAVDAAVRALYAEVEAEVARRRPLCLASGCCCHFEAWGHRLYVTGLEAAWCLAEVRRGAAAAVVPGGPEPRGSATSLVVVGREAAGPPTAQQVEDARQRGDCPFLRGRLCGAHLARPLGCRMFFCDPDAESWSRDLHEASLRRLRALHDANDIPYRYGEWREMLAHLVA